MTDLTDEAVKALAAAKPSILFADQDEDICIDDGRANNLVFCPARDDVVFPGDWPVLNPDVVAEIVARYNVAPDLARALLDARADAQAAVALVLEQAGLAVANVEIGFHDGISGEWHPMAGPSIISAACAAIRALANADGLAAVEALRSEARESAMQALASMGQAQEAYEAQLEAEAELAAAKQREAGLRAGHESIIANFGDIPGGHMAAVISRAALAQTPTDPGDGWTWNERLGWIGPDGKPAARGK